MSAPLYDRTGMARMIRTFFIEHKSVGTKKYKPNTRHDNEENWLRAADACIAAGANPMDWVDASFALAPLTVFANQLGGPAALARWKNHTQKPVVDDSASLREPPEAYELRPDIISTSSVMEDTKAEILAVMFWFRALTGNPDPARNHACMLDPFNAQTLRPHIRVALAGKHGLPDVVLKYREAAKDFLSTRPNHLECLISLGYDMMTYLNGN